MNSGHYGFPNILGLLRATAFRAIGKAGATAGATLAGGTTSGAPTSGDHDVGEVVVDQGGGTLWICTAAGTPGTWAQTQAGSVAAGPQATVLLSSVGARALSLWSGSANGAAPTDWQTPGFDDTAWGAAVAAGYTGGIGYASAPGVVPIWASASPASGTEQCLLRQHLVLPAGVPASATLVIEADDYLQAVYVNGTALTVSGTANVWPQTVSVPLSALHLGADNVLAVQAQNGAGAASVDYQFTVTYALGEAVPEPAELIDPSTAPGDLLYRANAAAGTLVVGFIGDSITLGSVGGGATPPPTAAGTDLAAATGRSVTVNNQGINGTTSADWLPGGTHYATAAAAFAGAGAQIVHVMLGTNDAKSGSMVSAATYRANMSAIAQELAAAGYTVVLTSPPYIIAGALGQWDATSDTQLLAYQGVLAGIANGTTIRLGDTTAYSYFLAHPAELSDGVHPTATGKTDLGQLWSNGLLAVVTALQRLAIGASGKVLTSDGTAPSWATPAASYTDPLTTKGDLVARTSSATTRKGVGSNGQVLTADSSQATGLAWATPSAGTSSPLTTKGDVWGYGSADARVPVGADGLALVADSTQTLGVRWGAPQPSSLLVLLPNPYNFVDDSATDNGQPPDFIMTAAGDVIGVGGL